MMPNKTHDQDSIADKPWQSPSLEFVDDPGEVIANVFNTKTIVREQRRAYAPNNVQNSWGRVFLGFLSSKNRFERKVAGYRHSPVEERFQFSRVPTTDDFVSFAKDILSESVLHAELLQDPQELRKFVVLRVPEVFSRPVQQPLDAFHLDVAEDTEIELPFLERAIHLEIRGYEESALDVIYDSIDDLLRGGQFEELDQFLNTISLKKPSTDILIGILTATVPARSRLSHRDQFFAGVQQEITQRGDYEVGLLSGLE